MESLGSERLMRTCLARSKSAIRPGWPCHIRIAGTYVLPIASQTPQVRALSGYLWRLGCFIDEVIVVDGSPDPIFAIHNREWSPNVRHIRPTLRATNGKVAGAMTGVRAARHDAVILADDDVRYRRRELVAIVALLEDHEVVRPQNFFFPLPWHARWDTGRSLLNRLGAGDWPGTLGVRRSALLEAGGYSGEVLFENLEMVRTIRANGGREAVALDLYVARRPPDASHFLSQRVRQAYDELARPPLMIAQLGLLPTIIFGLAFYPYLLAGGFALVVMAAEIGRQREGGATVFPFTSALWAIPWLIERSVTIWIALATRLFFGGVKYRETRLKSAATPMDELRKRVQDPSPRDC